MKVMTRGKKYFLAGMFSIGIMLLGNSRQASVPANEFEKQVVEVENRNDADDMAAAVKSFNGITISGLAIEAFPELDLRSGFDEKVVDEAIRRTDEATTTYNMFDG